MANIRRMYLRAEMSDGDTVAKMWGNAFCSMGGALLASVSLYEGMTS